jgi:hypothetical protein
VCIERGSTRWPTEENSFWEGLWTCKTNDMAVMVMVMVVVVVVVVMMMIIT